MTIPKSIIIVIMSSFKHNHHNQSLENRSENLSKRHLSTIWLEDFPKTYCCVSRREWMACWNLLGLSCTIIFPHSLGKQHHSEENLHGFSGTFHFDPPDPPGLGFTLRHPAGGPPPTRAPASFRSVRMRLGSEV